MTLDEIKQYRQRIKDSNMWLSDAYPEFKPQDRMIDFLLDEIDAMSGSGQQINKYINKTG